jgi:two-component system sensor histidine kinase PhoQ
VRTHSLSSRLLLASALLLPLFLGLTGIFLDSAFQRSLKAAVEERLRGHIYLLFSVAELAEHDGEPADLQMPNALIEPEFERLNSGLYAFIYNRTDELIWQSGSVGLNPAPDEILRSERQPGELVLQTIDYGAAPFFSAHYDVIWESDSGEQLPFRFVVLRGHEGFAAELAAYRSLLWRWLGAAALLLLLAQGAILRWGLQPLKQLARALDAMHSGHTNRITGGHPKELQEVVDNLNQVLGREEALRQRYRNSLNDLAHSLKTPLAVLQGSIGQNPNGDDQTLAEQVARMNQVVTYQLQRAVSSQQQGLHQRTPVAVAIERLTSALGKVYRDKQVICTLHLDPAVHFAGDEQDLLELLGNVLENAFKYCNHSVQVSTRSKGSDLMLIVGDDGPGIPAADQARILERGQRLDSVEPGQGIGLAITTDIVASYGGKITIVRSPLGGAEFRITLTRSRD